MWEGTGTRSGPSGAVFLCRESEGAFAGFFGVKVVFHYGRGPYNNEFSWVCIKREE